MSTLSSQVEAIAAEAAFQLVFEHADFVVLNKAAGVSFEFHRYLAHHAFANETAVGPGRTPATQFDPVWAQQAWDRTLHFFGKHLG